MLNLAVHRVNRLRNSLPGEGPASPEFARFVELYGRLRRDGVVDIVQVPETGNEGNYHWDIQDYEEAHGDDVREFLDLLGIKVKVDGADIPLPLREAIGGSASAVHLETRSAYDVLRAFGAGVEIPPAHLEAGLVEPLTWAVSGDRRYITVRSSEKPPDNATVQIRFRDRWFYIDATDTQSKRAFAFLRTFIGMRLADPGATHQAPVLTVPVN